MIHGKYLLVKGKAGMGNRLFSLLGSILYAKITGRQLVVDWTDHAYSINRENSFHNFFIRPTSPAIQDLHIDDTIDASPAIWKGQLQKSVDELMSQYEAEEADTNPKINAKYTIDFLRTDYQSPVAVRWAYFEDIYRLRPHLKGEFASWARLKNTVILKKLITEELELHPLIRQRVDEFKKQHFGEVTIGVHVRYTDRKIPFENYPVLAEKILRVHPQATIFLATDNQDVERHFRDRFDRLVTSPKWYPEPGTPIHRIRSAPNKLDVGVEALLDIYLLGCCNYIIYNRSTTFGRFASLVSQAPPNCQFDTQPFQMREVAKNVYDWMRVRLRL